jgi:hypothetical protein
MPNTTKVFYTLSKKDQEIQLQVESLVKTIESKELSAIFARITLGILLVEIKKKKGRDFYNVILESLLSKKKVQRTMKMVLRLDVNFPEAMKTTGSDTDISNRVKLLKIDNRFVNFKEESDLSKIHNLSLTKIETMKLLKTEQWNKVVSGTDKPYLDMIEEQIKKRKEDKEKEIASHQPEGMSKSEFEKIVTSGIFTAIKTIHEFSIINAKLESDIKSLESQLTTMKEEKHKMEIELSKNINNTNTVYKVSDETCINQNVLENA